MSKVLLDTDVLIDFLRRDVPTRAFLLELANTAVPCCSVITVAELFAGMRPEETEATTGLLDGLIIYPVTRQIAEAAGHFKARTKSRRLELGDCLIAATAFVEAASVATGNPKDYPMPEIIVIAKRR